MRPFGRLTPYRDALRIALGLCEPIRESRAMPLVEAGGRRAAFDIQAPVDVPGSDRAAMDGYAVIAEELRGAPPVTLGLSGRSMAGELGDTIVHPGCCLEVATGARLPAGATAVVPVEQTRRDGDRVVILETVAAGSHVSRRGEDLAAGDVILRRGETITPGAAAALASIGVQSIDVVRRPHVLLVPTGDELVPIGESLEPGQVYDSNSVGVRQLLEEQGARVDRTPIVRDDPGALLEGLKRRDIDLVVTLGGTSVGRHDLVLDVVEEIGEVLVHGIAMKPGKPVLVSRVGELPVLGLPGFPTSCLFAGYLFAEPMVRALGGHPVDHRRRAEATLTRGVSSPAGKLQFLTVVVDGDEATPVYRASSTITSMSRAHGWIEIDAEVTQVPAKSTVEVTFF
jgi:molybdopterin molybdotransferase